VLAQATDLARTGRYVEADRLLAENIRDLERMPAALDLRARVHAQQGQLREARSCWKRALQLDPTNEVYIAALERIKRYHLSR
jgi:tetratricopeptide (TPR) repeat protein